MGLEAATYVDDLVATNPLGSDGKAQGDDHIRLIKFALQNSLVGFPGVILATGAELQGATVNDYTVTLDPAPAAYTAPFLLAFQSTHANTGPATVQVNALGTKPLLAVDGSALAAGDIAAGGLVAAMYDGTSFHLFSGNDLSSRKADLAGATYSGTHDFTGAVVEVETQSPGDGSTKPASTAYVDGAAAALDAAKANLAGATYTGTHDFTGATTDVATAAPGTDDDTAASTAFVQQAAFQAALPGQAGKAGQILTTDGTNASWERASFAPDVIIQNQLPNGTSGGPLNSVYAALVLNTVIRNNNSIASLASNQVTLPPGNYYAEWSAMFAGNTTGGLGRTMLSHRLNNVTAGAELGRGVNVGVTTGSSATTTISSIGDGAAFFTLSTTSAIAVEAKGNVSAGTNGEPASNSVPEVYNTLKIWKQP